MAAALSRRPDLRPCQARFSAWLRARLATSALAVSLVAAASSGAAADAQRDYTERALAASRDAVGRVLGDHLLTDAKGRAFRLSELRGRPLVVNMIYTSCFDFCPTLTATLIPKVEVARAALGRGKFAVLTVGFDARNDTPARMRAYAHQLGIDDPEWVFASGSEATIAAVAADLGFVFERSAGGFDHVAQTTLVDAGGKVYRQVYGTDYKLPLLVEPLKKLVLGTPDRSGSLAEFLERVRILCTVYNARQERYHLDYGLFGGIAITIMIVAAAAVLLTREWRRSRRVPAARRR
jgi:protein SCO1/2